MVRLLISLLVFELLFLGCGRDPVPVARKQDPPVEIEPESSLRFVDVTSSAGLLFQHFDTTRNALLPEDNGSGVAVADYDNDGWPDLYFANLAGSALLDRAELEATRPPGRLFRNRGDGTFEDTTESSGLRHVGWDNAAVWADFNGDGWLDLVITGIDEIALYQNRGDRTFGLVSETVGLGVVDCIASGPAVGDIDRDGDLDLYVPCYVDFPWDRVPDREIVGGRPATMTTPASYPPQPDLFYLNDGRGHFQESSAQLGTVDESGRGLQASLVDLDNDGWLDLYVANDQSFDRLYQNLGDGKFADVTLTAGTYDPRAAMGLTFADYDSDGRLDLFITHWVGEENALYQNLSASGEMLFEDRTRAEGLAPGDPASVDWGTGLYDFDLDGDLDILVSSGSTVEDEWTLEVLSDPKMIPQTPRVYERTEEGWRDVSDTAGPLFSKPVVGRGASFADFDRDGLSDAVFSVHGGAPILLHNESSRRGHWLGLDLVGTSANRWAVGARVEVTAEGRSWTRAVVIGDGYCGSSSPRLAFGLGDAEFIEEVTVHWPDGTAQVYPGPIETDRVLQFTQGVEGWEEDPTRSGVARGHAADFVGGTER